MVEPVSTTIVVVKGICWICTALGIGYCAKKGHDAYSKYSKRQKEKLTLKGKSIEQAQKENERYQKEADELKKKYEENEEKIKALEKKAQEAKSKANDTNLSDEERIFWRNKMRDYEDEISTLRKNGKTISEKIKGLGDRIKNNSKVISGTLSNLEDRHWIWDLITLENMLIVGACYVMYRILKDEKEK